VDVWVLEDVEETVRHSAVQKTTNGVSSSDDESSDDEDAEEGVIEGQRWRNVSSLPRLQSGIIFMSFRPGPSNPRSALTNGLANGFHTSPPVEDRLLVLTSKHQLVEYEVLKGRFSAWSQRNPKSHLPIDFTSVKDRAMGGVCGSFQGSEKLLLYGPSWMWVFDLTRNYPSPETAPEAGALTRAPSQKRKRTVVDEDRAERQKYNSGAGDLIAASQAVVSLGTKVRKIVGKNGPSEEVHVESRRQERNQNHEDEDEEDNDHPFSVTGEPDFASLRREMSTEDGSPKRLTNGVHKDVAFRSGKKNASFAVVIDNTPNETESDRTSREDQTEDGQTTNPLYWHTYKFRDILGIVPFSDPTNMHTDDGKDSSLFEIALVERPIWDVELPDRYARDYE
jgi:U3 small nucleolar RNA-associated protein 4